MEISNNGRLDCRQFDLLLLLCFFFCIIFIAKHISCPQKKKKHFTKTVQSCFSLRSIVEYLVPIQKLSIFFLFEWLLMGRFYLHSFIQQIKLFPTISEWVTSYAKQKRFSFHFLSILLKHF